MPCRLAMVLQHSSVESSPFFTILPGVSIFQKQNFENQHYNKAIAKWAITSLGFHKMAIHVLYLDHAAEMGGAEFSLLELVRALKQNGVIEPVVAVERSGDFRQQLEAHGIETVPIDIPGSARHFAREQAGNPLALLGQTWHWQKPVTQLIQQVKAQRVDIIHSNTLKMHVISSFVAKATQKPLVWHMRDIPSHRGNALRILKGATLICPPQAVVAISNAVAESVRSIQPEKATQVIHDGFDFSMLPEENQSVKRGAMRTSLGLPEEGVILVSVGYFIPWKGQDVLIKAFSQIHRQHPDWHLALIGRPIFQFVGEEERLKALAEELGVSAAVHFLGEHQNIVEKLRAFDLFVCPSTREPMGRVVLEAMAAKVPIVATAAGGIPDLVRHDKDAWLVLPGDDEALAQGVLAMLADTARAEAYVQSAYQRLCSDLTLEQAAKQMTELYQSLLPRG